MKRVDISPSKLISDSMADSTFFFSAWGLALAVGLISCAPAPFSVALY
jgi:hypothetical protein